jgi:aspartyl-tRNA(Asn)/glutamyl-tRNA(Gln) amidotransferase subunit C
MNTKPKKASKPVQVSFDTTLHVAKLARLRLSLEEAKACQKDLNDMLFAFSDLKKVKTSAKPSFHPLDVGDVLRKDEPEPCLPHDVALSQTPHKERGFFKGPRVV